MKEAVVILSLLWYIHWYNLSTAAPYHIVHNCESRSKKGTTLAYPPLMPALAGKARSLVTLLLSLLSVFLLTLALILLDKVLWAVLDQFGVLVNPTPLRQAIRNVHDPFLVEHMQSATLISITISDMQAPPIPAKPTSA